mmetsp:Transcript_28877/g.43610  ORF Transcript_28877/g.43610 Transcript_28877/m.43610 type:complete len:106 (+) Transcript_28877:589-906(+)
MLIKRVPSSGAVARCEIDESRVARMPRVGLRSYDQTRPQRFLLKQSSDDSLASLQTRGLDSPTQRAKKLPKHSKMTFIKRIYSQEQIKSCSPPRAKKKDQARLPQ